MSSSPSRAMQRDLKLPSTPARKRHVQATNAWAQEEASQVEDSINIENVWSLASPEDVSAGGNSGAEDVPCAPNHFEIHENDPISRSERATLVREKNSWAQNAISIKDNGRFLHENIHTQDTSTVRTREEPIHSTGEEMGLAIGMPKSLTAVSHFPSDSKKLRSVTEPTPAKSFSINRKMSFKGIRNAIAGTKAGSSDSLTGKRSADAPPVPPLRLDKASRVLGLNVHADWRNGDLLQPPASAPGLEFSNSYRDQTFKQVRPDVVGRKTTSTPIPVKESKPVSPLKSKGPSGQQSQGEMKPDGIVLGHGNLSPTKNGSYGTVGRLEVVGNSFARVASQQGIIESMNDEADDKTHMKWSPTGHPSSEVSSPSIYERVWENNPHVGHSLPPFSPALPHLAKENHQLPDRQLETGYSETSSIGNTSGKAKNPLPRFSALTLDSIISAHSSLGSSSTCDSAEVPHLFAEEAEKTPVALAYKAILPGSNAVPPPPESFPGFQPSSTVDVAQALMLVHHHIETSFDRLLRLMEDKTERTHDELIRRSESLEEKIQKNGKGASKHDLNGLKNEFEVLGHDLHVTATTGTEMKRIIYTLLTKVEALDGLVKDSACKCDHLRQEGAFLPRENPTFFNNPASMMSPTGYFQVPLQYHSNQFGNPYPHFGSFNSYASFAPPNTRTGASFVPQRREATEEYYRPSENPQMMRVEVPEIEIDEHSTFFGKGKDCSISFGGGGPEGISYEMPAYMCLKSQGLVIIDESPASISTEGSSGVPVTDANESSTKPGPASTIPFGIDGGNGTLYDLPSFMSFDMEGNVVLDQFDEETCSFPVGDVPLSNEGPNGPTYEIPSCLSINEDSETEIIDEEKTATETEGMRAPAGITAPHGVIHEVPYFIPTNENSEVVIDKEGEVTPMTANIRMPNGVDIPLSMHINGDGVVEVDQIGDQLAKQDKNTAEINAMPTGIRMPNGVVYELPSFMSLNENGALEINITHEADTSQGEVNLPEGDIPFGIRGPNGVLYELPSFLRINKDGQAEIIQQAECAIEQSHADKAQNGGVPIDFRTDNRVIDKHEKACMRLDEEGLVVVDVQGEAVVDQRNEEALPVGTVPIGIRGPNGVLYEVPSFLKLDHNGLEEVMQQQEDSGAEHNNTDTPTTDGVPIGIRMNNGVVYEIPSFMNINEDGSIEIDHYDSFGTNTTATSALVTSEYSTRTEGPEGIWSNESTMMEDVFSSLAN